MQTIQIPKNCRPSYSVSNHFVVSFFEKNISLVKSSFNSLIHLSNIFGVGSQMLFFLFIANILHTISYAIRETQLI